MTPRVAIAEDYPGQPFANAVFVEKGPEIDANLDDPVWQQAEVITDFTQVEPLTGAPPSFRTEVRILTDGNSLFFSYRAYDPEPNGIVANRMGRNEIFFFDDSFNMILDTFHDRRNGFFFQVNPNGGRRDGTFERDAFEENWDGIWYAKARIDEDGWVAEVEIPFQTLAFQPGADVWGLNLTRRIRRFNEDIRWADPTVERGAINVGRAGRLYGMSVAQQGVGLDVVPALSLRGKHDEVENKDDFKAEPSFDAFYRIIPSLAASVTANTDFAQTEIDSARINLTRFELFFPEKREFFLRDKGIFDFAGLDKENAVPFFSRRIGLDEDFEGIRLLGGGKVAGRAGPFNIGLLSIQQDGNAGVDDTNLSVARVAANVLEESTVGFILTHGDPTSDDENLLVGGDFNYRSSEIIPGRFVKGGAWVQQTFSDDEDRSYGSRSTAYGANLSYPNDKVNWKFNFKEIQQGFNPALGFVNRTEIRRYSGDYRYRFRSQSKAIRTLDVRVDGNVTTDRDDTLESGFFSFRPIKITNQVDDSIELQFAHLYEDVPEVFYLASHIGVAPGRYNFSSVILNLESSQARKLRFKFTTGYGGFYDGSGLRVAPLIEWRPSAHWLFSFQFDNRWFTGMTTCPGSAATICTSNSGRGNARTTSFDVRVVRFLVQINFTPDISWITIAQYDNLSDEVNFQTRFRWIFEPGRELFLVLGQGFDASPGDLRFQKTEPVAKLRWTFRF